MRPGLSAECTGLNYLSSSYSFASRESWLGCLGLSFSICKWIDTIALPHSHTAGGLHNPPLAARSPSLLLFPLPSPPALGFPGRYQPRRKVPFSSALLQSPLKPWRAPHTAQPQAKAHFVLLFKCFECFSNVFTAGLQS